MRFARCLYIFASYVDKITHYDQKNTIPYIRQKDFDDTFGYDNLNLYKPYKHPVFCWPYLPSDPGVNNIDFDQETDEPELNKNIIPEKRFCYPYEQDDYQLIKTKSL